jgi:hypothetical protein
VYKTEQLLGVIEEHIQAYNDGDEARFRATLTHDAVMAFRAVDRVCRGVDDITAAFWSMRQHFNDVHWQITNGFSNGSFAAVEIIRSGSNKLSNVRVAVPECAIYTIRQGKIGTISHYTDRMTELIQLGAIADLGAPDLPEEPETSAARVVSPRPNRVPAIVRTLTRRARQGTD